MQLDESVAARAPGAQVVHIAHFGVAEHDLADAGAILVGQLPVHQHVQRPGDDFPGVVKDKAGDRQAEYGIDPQPAQRRHQHQRHDDPGVDQQVADVMEGIGADRDRFGLPHDIALEAHQHQREHDGEYHHADADGAVVDRPGLEQPVAGLEQEERRRAGDQGRLTETGERLGLAVAETVRAVRRLERLSDCDQVDQGGRGVEQRIDQRG